MLQKNEDGTFTIFKFEDVDGKVTKLAVPANLFSCVIYVLALIGCGTICGLFR